MEKQQKLRDQIIKARKNLESVKINQEILKKIAKLCVRFQTDGHRADITITRTSKTLAAFYGRKEVNEEDVKKAAKLSLNHRLRRLPFEEQNLNKEEIDDFFDEEKNQKKESKNDLEGETNKQQILNPREEIFEIPQTKKMKKILEKKRIKEKMNISGKRIEHPTSSKQGKYTGGLKPRNFNFTQTSDIALNETLNNAALEPENRISIKNGKTLTIQEEHIHVKKRRGKSSYLIIFCVDASGSMGVKSRMESVKGAIFSILQRNYVNRDKVALVVFRKEKAEVISS